MGKKSGKKKRPKQLNMQKNHRNFVIEKWINRQIKVPPIAVITTSRRPCSFMEKYTDQEKRLFQALHAKKKRRNSQQQCKQLGSVVIPTDRLNDIQSSLQSVTFENPSVNESTNYEHIAESPFKRDFLRVISESIDDKLMRKSRPIVRNPDIDANLFEQFQLKQTEPHYCHMLNKRSQLPSFAAKDNILQTINDNQIVVISGETGCGKTTQIPQFILDDYITQKKGSVCNIICTQPRRISAISVAERVAKERGESLGQSVGYQIRLEKCLPSSQGSICFCTTGVVLKMMETDASLSWVSHLILDEIHERDILSDFILALVKKIVLVRKDLKIILMSATLNAEKFSWYYNNAPHISIPGFTFPVQEYYLEDVISRTQFIFERCSLEELKDFRGFIEPYIIHIMTRNKYSEHVCTQLKNPKSEHLNLELILALLINICAREVDQGAILVFLTGYKEISALINMMAKTGLFPPHRFHIYPLHSLMPTISQKQIFEAPPTGVRKIIVSTNIAETSLTIDDVVFVIDCGKVKVSGFDAATNTETLAHQWVSRANADQRRGRAGRVQRGACFHLFSRARLTVLEQYQAPEILRSRLESVILSAKVLQLGQIEPFFRQLMDSPSPQSIFRALELLKRLNALTDDENLTPLGYHLAKLPMAPQLGKMLLFGAIFSCVDPILSVVTALDFKDPFQLTVGCEREAHMKKLELARGVDSDHLLYHNALTRFELSGHSNQFCWEYFLSAQNLKSQQGLKKQFMTLLYDMKFVINCDYKSWECNQNSHNVNLVKAVICAGLYPNIAISKKLGKAPRWTPELNKVVFHQKSILWACRNYQSNILVYFRKVFSEKDYIHDATLVKHLPVIFFGDDCQFLENGIIKLKNTYLEFVCSKTTATVVKEVRDKFKCFLEHKMAHPGPVVWGPNNETKILGVVVDMITHEDRFPRRI